MTSTRTIEPYLQLEKLAKEFLGGRSSSAPFTPSPTSPSTTPTVRVWAVNDRPRPRHRSGTSIRTPSGKQSGAWMNAYRNQERFDNDVTTIVSNNATS